MNEKVPVINRVLCGLPILRDADQGTNLFSRMLGCAYCTGFHAGWVVWCIGVFPHPIASDSSLWEGAADLISFSFASSAFCYALDTFIQWVERQSNGN